jgi:hypothetical protein
MTDEERNQFIAAAKPLMRWMAENLHPHYTASVTATDAELTEGTCSYSTPEFVHEREHLKQCAQCRSWTHESQFAGDFEHRCLSCQLKAT